MQHRRRRQVMVGLVVMTGGLGWAARAQAEPSADDRALATQLFQEGRALLAEDRIPEACQKLEESQRLDPAGGTILNLALCHEREGRFARSWGEFNDALMAARRDGRRDREAEAASHVRDLAPRLSRLTIVVAAEAQVEGLVIERDGRALGRGAWSTAIPIDGGEHVVRATALGREPFTVTVVMGKESDAQTVLIPVLATPVVVVTAPRVSSPSVPLNSQATLLTPARLRWVGVGAAAVGTVLLGTAGYMLKTALDARDQAAPHCFPDGCDDVGLPRRNDAVRRGNLATVLGVSGAVLVAGGATLFFLERRSGAPAPESRLATRFTFAAAPGAAMTGFEGSF